jgi:hypothetical protein
MPVIKIEGLPDRMTPVTGGPSVEGKSHPVHSGESRQQGFQRYRTRIGLLLLEYFKEGLYLIIVLTKVGIVDAIE